MATSAKSTFGDEIGAPENAEPWLDAAVLRGDRLVGFGHRVYRVRDPRSDVVKAAAATLGHAGRLIRPQSRYIGP